jgi:hypothetical protein
MDWVCQLYYAEIAEYLAVADVASFGKKCWPLTFIFPQISFQYMCWCVYINVCVCSHYKFSCPLLAIFGGLKHKD